MRIFHRKKAVQQDSAPLPGVLPQINQRITIKRENGDPLASRVDDETADHIVISAPATPLSPGETIQITWENEDGWYKFESRVDEIHPNGRIPTVTLTKHGTVRQFDDRRGDLRRRVSRPLDLSVINACTLKTGRALRTHTVELSPKALRFSTNAPLMPGDVLEAKLTLSNSETIAARIKVIRMDSISSSWRQLCTASFDQILMSDRSRIARMLEEQVQQGAQL